MSQASIYVAIASLDDDELVPTILDLFEKSEYPSRVFAHVSLSSISKNRYKEFLKSTKKYSSNLTYQFTLLNRKNFEKELGVGIGRDKAASRYSDQDYFLQIDSHSLFSYGWDSNLIKIHSEAMEVTHNPRTLITGYAGMYEYIGSDRVAKPGDDGQYQYPFFTKDSFFYDVIPRWDAKGNAWEKIGHTRPNKKYVPVLKFNANFSFGDREFANNLGLDRSFFFFEEELIQTMNLIKSGFSLVFPNTGIADICHLYSSDTNGKYGNRMILGSYSKDLDATSKNRISKNWKAYLDDPVNKEVIKIYEAYTKISMRFGNIRSQAHIPSEFLNQGL